MAISGVNNTSNTSYRDKFTTSGLAGTEETDETSTQEKIWNAVFEENKMAVSADDFLNLMVTQLKNQDFMNPVDDTQYITQLAQFTTMQQMTDMANYSKTSYVMSLVGKNVTAAKMNVSGTLLKETGQVEKVSLVNNEFAVYVNGKRFTLEQVMEIGTTESEAKATETSEAVRKDYLLSMLNQNVKVQEVTKKKNEEGEEEEEIKTFEGLVERVSSANGEYRVYIGGNWYSLDDVVEIGAAVQEAEA